MDPSTPLLSAAEAAARLGVKPATLYAYVSRGIIARQRGVDGRSWFDPEHVRRLAARSRGRRGGHAEIAIPTAVSHVDPDGRITYRGRDACALADGHRFEQVATFLWSGTTSPGSAWFPDPRSLRAAVRTARILKRAAPHVRLAPAAAAGGSADPAVERDVATAKRVVATLVDALHPIGTDPSDDLLASRLWTRLTKSHPTARATRALDAALGAQADRGLVGSTLVARLCASRGADPYAVVVAGLSVGTVSVREAGFEHVRGILQRVAEGADPSAVVANDPPRPPANPEPQDPRADLLLSHTTDAFPGRASTVARTIDSWEASGATVDASVALAAFCWAADMVDGAAETISLVSRSAGWLAHALEEYRDPTAFRTRDVYTGPPPEAGGRPATLEAVQRYLRS